MGKRPKLAHKKIILLKKRGGGGRIKFFHPKFSSQLQLQGDWKTLSKKKKKKRKKEKRVTGRHDDLAPIVLVDVSWFSLIVFVMINNNNNNNYNVLQTFEMHDWTPNLRVLLQCPPYGLIWG